MFTINKLRTAIAIAIAGAPLAGSGVAAAAPLLHQPGTVTPVATNAVSVAQTYAFPSGVKGSGTEATCALYSGELAGDHGAIEGAQANNDLAGYNAASAQLEQDTTNALEAGCIVID